MQRPTSLFSLPSFAAAAVLVTACASARASSAQLDAGVATPLVVAGKANTVYLKVGLRGLEAEGKTRTAVNVALVLDRSGSMAGEKLARAKEAAMLAVDRLGDDDIVSLIVYDDSVQVLVPATKARDRETLYSAIRNIRDGGSTALFAGVAKGAAEARKFLDKNRLSRIILLSDGLANVGPSSPGELAELGTSLAKEGISVSTIGLGLGYNEDLMQRLASASDGNHAFVEEPKDLARIFNAEFGDVLSVVARDVGVTIRCGDGVRPVRVLNRDGLIDGQNITVSLAQLYARQEKYVLIEAELRPLGVGEKRQLATVEAQFHDTLAKSAAKVSGSVSVSGTADASLVEQRTNAEVMVVVVEQLANEKNKLALSLRDQGQVDKARSMLKENAAYLGEQHKRLKSPKLQRLESVNRDNADNLDGDDWNRTRKDMRKVQYELDSQQSY